MIIITSSPSSPRSFSSPLQVAQYTSQPELQPYDPLPPESASAPAAAQAQPATDTAAVDVRNLPPLLELKTVSTHQEAREAVEVLRTRYKDCVFACDTEVWCHD